MTKDLTPNNPRYYLKKIPLGLFVLLNSCKEQGLIGYGDDLSKATLYAICDWQFLFMATSLLKESIEKPDRWNLAYNTTTFLLYLRIFYDSLANVIHLFLKLQFPSESRLWLKGGSFNDLMKKVRDIPLDGELVGLKRGIDQYDFGRTFSEIKNLRDRVKNPSAHYNSHRLIYMTNKDFPITGDLKKEISIYLFKTISFTDFIGDYLFAISKNPSVVRMEKTHDGYDVGSMEDDKRKLYEWFITDGNK